MNSFEANNSPAVTIQDIAREAGVSKATVSLVLNSSPKVSSKTYERVRAVMEGLHYQPNEDARKLAQRRWIDSNPPVPKFAPTL
jgi:DNA-binding LacI/PurR family transcriptional regulator